jgi:biopolymer transport protein ExbD
MGHKRRTIGGGGDHGGGSGTGHGDRPWVYFMVDCFFLITEFFVITFKFKNEESVLPQRLPPGGTVPSKTQSHESKEQLNIHVFSNNGQAVYKFLDSQASLPELVQKLANSTGAGGDRFSVRVSYEADVPWESVMAVFNACTKVKIAECGLIPLRGDKAAPMRM